MKRSTSKRLNRRRGMIAVLSAALFVVMLAMVAFAVDIGYMAMVRTELQAAADSAALAAAGSSNQTWNGMVQTAQGFAQYHQVAGRSVVLNSSDVQYGTWDVTNRVFTALPAGQVGTAVKVTVRTDPASGGNTPMFFGRVLGADPVSEQASAVAMVNPRDIAFVVDLSGSMNWDTTPGKPNASQTSIDNLCTDLGIQLAGGTATASGVLATDMTRALTVFGSGVKPPIITSTTNPGYSDSSRYWTAYFNWVRSNGKVISSDSYLQMIMKCGRDDPVVDAVKEVKDWRGNITQPALPALYSPVSIKSGACPYHSESTDGGTFQFPPREMPTHAVRRAIIAALAVIRDRNSTITDASQKDKVSLIVFDAKNTTSDKTHVRVVQTLTDNYTAVMNACLTLQACASNGNSTNSEGGINCATNHIKPVSQGGAGRENANKVVVFLTDGNANLHESSTNTINNAKTQNPSADWGSNEDENAALMQSLNAQKAGSSLFAVGVGRDGNQTFMNRMARNAGTAIPDASDPQSSTKVAYPIASDSTAYEATLKSIFQGIITNPKLRLVQ